MKRWWLVLALLLSVGVNAGVLAVLALDRLRPPGPPAFAAPAVGRGSDRLADHLGLEGERRQRFIELQAEFFEGALESRRRMRALRRELRRELMGADPDRRRVEEIVASIGSIHAEVEGALARLILDTRELLDRRQQAAYLRFLGRMRGGGMRPGGPPGRRPPAHRPGGPDAGRRGPPPRPGPGAAGPGP